LFILLSRLQKTAEFKKYYDIECSAESLTCKKVYLCKESNYNGGNAGDLFRKLENNTDHGEDLKILQLQKEKRKVICNLFFKKNMK